MYCNYTYIAGATPTDIHNDLKLLVTADGTVTGDALVTSLSTSCDKTNTVCTKATGVASGWSTVSGSLLLTTSDLTSASSTMINMPASLRWCDVVYCFNKYWLIGKTTAANPTTNIIYTTTDWKTFTQVTLPYTAAWYRFCYISTAPTKLFIFSGSPNNVSDADTIYVFTTDGTNFYTQPFPNNLSLSVATIYSSYNSAVGHCYSASSANNYTLSISSNGNLSIYYSGTAASLPSGTTVGASGTTAGVVISSSSEQGFSKPCLYQPDFSTSIWMMVNGNISGVTSKNLYVSNNHGQTWYIHNTPYAVNGVSTATNWAGVASSGNVFVIVQGGRNVSSLTVTKAYFHVYNASTTLSGTQVWVDSPFPVSFSYIAGITSYKGYFIIFGGNEETKSDQILVGKYDSVGNSITWELKNLDNQINVSNFNECVISPAVSSMIRLGGAQISTATPLNYGEVIKIYSNSIVNSHIRAATSDAATYKYANIAVSPTGVFLRSAELFSGSSYTNLCYSSDSTKYTQQLDLDNGGVIFISCSNRHLLMLSYQPAINKFGSSAGGFCGVVEFTRDDAWNTGTYPTHVFFTSETFSSGMYIPKLKNNISSPDVNLKQAILYPSLGIDITKKILNATNTGVANISSDIRLNNTVDYNYAILGGILLGGIKRTTDNSGSNLEEATLGATTYVVWEGTKNSTARYLVPKV